MANSPLECDVAELVRVNVIERLDNSAEHLEVLGQYSVLSESSVVKVWQIPTVMILKSLIHSCLLSYSTTFNRYPFRLSVSQHPQLPSI